MSEFRTCPDTGFKIHLPAEKLIKWNAVTSVVFLLLGGVFGLLVALTRWPEVHLLPDDLFYLALTAHGLDILLVWIIFFEVALLYFTSAVLLNSRLAAPGLGWVSYGLMIVGALITNVAVLQGNSSVMFTSYVPLQAEPHFYIGIILFAVGALLACFIFLGTLVIAKREKTYEGSVPLVTFGVVHGPDRQHRHLALQGHLVGHGALLAADQRVRPHRVLVRHGGHSVRRQAAEREGEPLRVLPVHPVPAARLRPPPFGGAGAQRGVQDLQHLVRSVPGGPGFHDPRPDGSRRGRGGPAQEGLHQGPVRMAAQGAVGQSGVLRLRHLGGLVRFPRRHLRCRGRYRAA